MSFVLRPPQVFFRTAWMVLSITFIVASAACAFMLQARRVTCNTIVYDSARYDCVSVYFATPRALGSFPRRTRIDAEGFVPLVPADDITGNRHWFSEDPGKHDLILGRAIVLMPQLSAKDARRAEGDRESGRTDLEGSLRSDFQMDQVKVAQVTVAPDGLLTVDKTYFRNLNRSVRSAAANSSQQKRSVLLFVHGFDSTFEQNIKQTARIAADLNFDQRKSLGANSPYALGQPLLYTWPTRKADPHEIILAAELGAVPGGISRIARRGKKTEAVIAVGIGSVKAALTEDNDLQCPEAQSITGIVRSGAIGLAAGSIRSNPVGIFVGSAAEAAAETWDQYVEKYKQSRCRAEIAAQGFDQYLRSIAENTDVQVINVVAYSMGAQVVARALPSFAEWYGRRKSKHPLTLHIAYYGADIGVDAYEQLVEETDKVFGGDPDLQVNLQPRINVYSNHKDLALLASSSIVLNGKPRLGRHESGSAPFLFDFQSVPSEAEHPAHASIDMSDLADVFARGLSHDVFQKSPEMLSDIACFMRDKEMSSRNLKKPEGQLYWVFDTGERSTEHKNECGGPAWQVEDLDCDNLFEITFERARALFSLNRSARLKEQCQQIKDDPAGFCERHPQFFSCAQPDGPKCTLNRTDEKIERPVKRFEMLFDLGKYGVSDERRDQLKREYADAYGDAPLEDRVIWIIGHADRKNSEEFNLKLSRQRAEAVGKVFKNLGAINIKVEWTGEDDLKVETVDEVPETQNRRVEVIFGISDPVTNIACTE